MGNRLKELRRARGLSAERLAARAGTSRSEIYKLERGERRMTEAWIERLAAALDVAPADLLEHGREVSVPVTLAVAAAFGPCAPDRFDRAEPYERLQAPPRLGAAEDCFAAEVLDDSADRLYPPGSVLFCRRLAALDGPLRVGDKVVVRHYGGARHEGDVIEVLAGLLDRTLGGDLVLLTRSRNRQVPASVLVKPAPPPAAGFSERFRTAAVVETEVAVDYRVGDDDPAEIIGLVVMALTPETVAPSIAAGAM